MARHLQALAAAIALAAATPAAPFSHRVHLKLKPDCSSCHTRVSGSSSAADNLMPDPATCRPCHTTVAPIKPPAKTLVARFDHKKHLAMGNIARLIAAAIDSKKYLSSPGDIRRHLNTRQVCQGCHRGLAESDAVSAAAYPQMADCLVCHTDIDPPFSCEKCHVTSSSLKPPNHVEGFMSSHASPAANLNKTTCAVCHGRTFTCLGCHTR